MCGIVGAASHRNIVPVLVQGLQRLEYRGYDSCGVAVHAGGLTRARTTSRVADLVAQVRDDKVEGLTGIAHTRWATHGAATTQNAHPHASGPVAVVHNGVIENFRELRAELTAAGLCFESETDTETVALLTRHYMDQGLAPVEAAKATLKRLHGAFALCFLFAGEDDLMIAARKGSPLAIGHGAGEMFVGSDAIALAPMTDRITYLDEGDWAVITRQGATIYDQADRLANRAETRIQIDATRIEKAGYKHFMAKEIAEQPVVIANALGHYIQNGAINLPAAVDFHGVDRLTLVACGTASFACHVAKYWFEQIAGLPVD
eukprot:gene39478-52039_t